MAFFARHASPTARTLPGIPPGPSRPSIDEPLSGRQPPEPGNDVAEGEGERLFQLRVGARLGRPVVAPAQEVGKVAEPGALQVLVLHLEQWHSSG